MQQQRGAVSSSPAAALSPSRLSTLADTSVQGCACVRTFAFDMANAVQRLGGAGEY